LIPPHELEPRQEGSVPAHARHGHDAVLERLPESLQDGSRELRLELLGETVDVLRALPLNAG
jgi:hypothetical protein